MRRIRTASALRMPAGHVEVINALLRHGADPALVSSAGHTAADIATELKTNAHAHCAWALRSARRSAPNSHNASIWVRSKVVVEVEGAFDGAREGRYKVREG